MVAAKSKGLKVPAEPWVMHKGMKEKFEHQSADADFNHDFMQQQMVPTLEEHLAEAKKLESKLGKSERSARDE
jgi:putative membrane protein